MLFEALKTVLTKFDFQDIKPIIIIDLQDEREEIVNCARIFVEQKYSKQRLIKDIEALYTELMKNQSKYIN